MTRIGSLFSGYGGLDMGAQAVTGGHVIWHSEIEPAAARLLNHHHPDVPNLGDITAVDWAEIPRVDVLTGGFPCQDVSSAGRRAGMKPGTRSGLWAHMARAINVLRPNLVVIENVRGLLSAEAHSDLEPCPWCLGDQRDRPLRALGAVLGDLSVLGYDARWCGLRAADAGAPHARYRVFIAAWPAADAGGVEPERRGVDPVDVADSDGVGPARAGAARGRRRGPADDGVDVDADPDGAGLEGRRGFAGADAGTAVERGSRAASDSSRATRRGTEPEHLAAGPEPAAEPRERSSQVAWGDYGPAIRRWELILGRAAPEPTMTGKRGGQQLSPAFVEWLMGLPAGHVTGVLGLSRNEQLKLLGNGVVPQQAELALRYLLATDHTIGVAA